MQPVLGGQYWLLAAGGDVRSSLLDRGHRGSCRALSGLHGSGQRTSFLGAVMVFPVLAGEESSGRMPHLTQVGFPDPCLWLPQGTPKLLRTSDCDFVFEWGTPLVCPDDVRTEGCSLTDEQLYYSFNLSSLSKTTFKVRPLTQSLQPPRAGVCSGVRRPGRLRVSRG